jgi:hypothetical protein
MTKRALVVPLWPAGRGKGRGAHLAWHHVERGRRGGSSGMGLDARTGRRRRGHGCSGSGTRRHATQWKDRGGEVLTSRLEATMVGLNPGNRVKNHSNEIEFKFETRSNFLCSKQDLPEV